MSWWVDEGGWDTEKSDKKEVPNINLSESLTDILQKEIQKLKLKIKELSEENEALKVYVEHLEAELRPGSGKLDIYR
jgi:regulator of replication initiation timing